MAQIMEPTQVGDSETQLPPLTLEEIAPHFPQLEIMECLGRGGMGVIYKVRQRSLNRIVALKLLAPERVDDPHFATRFEKEAQALATLNHPHIVGVYDFGQAGGFYFLLMEFVDGVNLRQLLQTKRLTPQEALRIVPQVCEALQCAHENNIVHCDIKPENLLVDKMGTVKIADFGIAKMIGHEVTAPMTDAETQNEKSASYTLGTPTYAAPEQQSGNADQRADIYSLGVVLYELLTGKLPTKEFELLTARSGDMSTDLRLDKIVQRAMHTEPSLRFQTAADLRRAIEDLIHQGTSHVPAENHKRLWKACGLIAACGVIFVTGWFFLNGQQKRTPRPGAEIIDFNLAKLTDAFSENVLMGRSGYALTPLGMADTKGLVLAESMGSEGTLVYHKKSYNLSKLASLEISCCFKREGIGAASHALAIGLTGKVDGHLSGVKGAAFMALRLKAENESLRFQFMSKEADLEFPRSWMPNFDLMMNEGEWYRLKVVFILITSETVRVTGEVCEILRNGDDGKVIAHFQQRDFGEPIFPVKEILTDNEVWVALRANGPGGAALVDDLQIMARPLPVKISAKTDATQH